MPTLLTIKLLLYIIWASLVAQMAKRLPAVRETWVWSLSWEDPLENYGDKLYLETTLRKKFFQYDYTVYSI